MSLFRFILKKNVPTPKLDSYDSYLFVGPHPDDIEVACGASVASLIAKGKKVGFLIVTDGSGGCLDDDTTSEQLVDIRKEECHNSAKLLGVSDITMLNYTDGGVYDKHQMSLDIAKAIVDFNPDVVLCPDHRTLSECHPDHLNVGQAATDAFFFVQYRRIAERLQLQSTANVKAIAYYYTSKPNSYINVSGHVDSKFRAIACHKSQFDNAGVADLKMYFMLRNTRMAFRNGFKPSEAYRMLTVQQSHCLPEYGE